MRRAMSSLCSALVNISKQNRSAADCIGGCGGGVECPSNGTRKGILLFCRRTRRRVRYACPTLSMNGRVLCAEEVCARCCINMYITVCVRFRTLIIIMCSMDDCCVRRRRHTYKITVGEEVKYLAICRVSRVPSIKHQTRRE